MCLRGAMVLVLVLICMAAHAQPPRLLLRAAFDGSCALEMGGEGELLAAEFVDGRDGQAIKATEDGRPGALVPLGAANPDEGTLMFWFRCDEPKPGPDGANVRWSPVATAAAPGPDVDIVQAHHQAVIRASNPWDERHRGGAQAVYSHLIPGKWYHLACTWQKERSDLCFWLFGEAQSDTLGKWNALERADDPFGEMLSVGSPLGAVDDLRIYDRALTGDEIIAAGEYRDGECMYDEGKIFFDTVLDIEGIRGELIVEDSFDEPWQDNWVLEGPGVLTQEGGRLRLQEPEPGAEGANHTVLWNRTPHPRDFIAEWEFTPNEVSGLCIVFFCAKGINGEDIFDVSLAPRDGTFTGYTSGDINCYHISYFRNTCTRSPNCALRKNLGFWRASAGYDYIPLEAGVTSRLTLVKRGAHIQLAINDRVSIDWVDDGVTRGPVWGSGHFGLRQMMTTDGWYDNFRIWAIKRERRAARAMELDEALRQLKRELEELYGERLKGLYLFGSRARGDAEPDSDVDVAVVLDGSEPPPDDRQRLSEITADLSLEADACILTSVIGLDDWDAIGSTFIWNVRRDAVPLGPGYPPVDAPPAPPTSAREVQGRLRQAHDQLAAARRLTEMGSRDSAASGAYIAMHRAAQAALASVGYGSSKHAAVIAEFGRRLIAPGLLPTDLHQPLRHGFEVHRRATYEYDAAVTDDEAKTTLDAAEHFIAAIEEYLRKQDE